MKRSPGPLGEKWGALALVALHGWLPTVVARKSTDQP